MSALLPCGLKAAEVDEMARAAYAEQGLVDEWDHLVPHIKARWRRSIIAAWNQRATPTEVAALRAEVERLRGALRPLVAVIPDICNALDLDPDETSIRVRVDGGARDGEVLAERTLADMLTVARAALAKEPGDEG